MKTSNPPSPKHLPRPPRQLEHLAEKGANSSSEATEKTTTIPVVGSLTAKGATDEVADLRAEKIRVWRNIVLVDLAFMLYNTPMLAYTNIMSSLNSSEGMGLASESINAGVIVLASIFFTNYATQRWSAKVILIAACISGIPYIMINFYVVWATIIPGSVFVGIGDSLIMQAISVYYSEIATYYCRISGVNRDALLLRLFGLCGVMSQCSFILGNLLVWGILDTHTLWSSEFSNSTLDVSHCGAAFCQDSLEGNGTLFHPEQWRVYSLCGVFTAMGVSAAFSLFFVDDYSAKVRQNKPPKYRDVAFQTVSLLKHPVQLMLCMICILNGMYEGFFFGDFTQAYVSCSIGIARVGLIMICYGVVNGGFSVCQESLSGWLGRLPVITFGGSLLAGLIAVLLYWQPDPEQYHIYFILGGFWGMADAVLGTQISALVGKLYEDNSEVGYSAMAFWFGIGSCVAFGYSYYLCMTTKLYILAGNTVVAMIGYFMLEGKLYHDRTEKERDKCEEDKECPDLTRTTSISISQTALVNESL